MSEITSIEPQIKDKERCNIYVDGRFYCGIKLEVAVKYHLRAGMQIEKSKLDEIQLETEKSQAVDKAMTFISASMKTAKQIRDHLAKKGYTEAVIEYAVGKLEYYNLIDDYAYCRAFVNSSAGKGKKMLEAELVKRGADVAAREQVMEEVEEDAGAALAVLEKYMRSKQTTKENLYKGFRYLLSKGYSYDTAKAALSAFDCNEDY